MGASKRVSFPIVGSFNVERIPKIDSQQTINQYEVVDKQGKKPNFLAPTPGFQNPLEGDAPLDLGGPNVRGMYVFRGEAFAVSGDAVYRLDNLLAVTGVSPPLFSTTSGPVIIEANETQICFSDGTTLLVYDTGTTTLSIANPGFIVADITFLDGYIIAIKKDTDRFYISPLNNVLVPNPWAALDFALVNSSPTILVGCQRLKRRIFLFGETITEVWLDAGLASFPLRRDNNLLLEHGLGARGSLVEGFGRMFYLSKDKDGYSSIVMVAGTMPKAISTKAIELQIQEMDDPSDATAFVYRMNGHVFYQINFTYDDKTFVYDATMDRWHTLESKDGGRHRADTHMFFPVLNALTGKEESKHFIGAYDSGNIYELDDDIFSYAGEIIKRSRVAGVLSSPVYNEIQIDRFELDLLQGIGLANPPNDDPKVFLSISRDGGLTYQNFGGAKVGKIGESRYRTYWDRLGRAREHIIRIDFYDALPFYVLGASIDMQELPE